MVPGQGDESLATMPRAPRPQFVAGDDADVVAKDT
jgi:hypothetical protein